MILSARFQTEIASLFLKPNNVLVVNGEVKLLDFGIASHVKHVTDLAGTLDYMAPELLLRQRATLASDLYATGVLMHQLLTGAFPFSRDSVTQMLGDILGDASERTLQKTVAELVVGYRSGQALPPIERTVQVSAHIDAALGDIVQKLLKRNPEERYADASLVLRDLAAAVKVPLPLETSATRESFLQATELVGRDSELAALKQALEQAKQARCAGILVGGESGVGKSRLISELRTQALVRGFWVAEGQSVSDGGLYYEEWLPLLRALCVRVELSDDEAAVMMELLPDVRELIGRPITTPPPSKPDEMPARLYSALVAILRKLNKPLLVILEDLQWARRESLTLLEQLLKSDEALKLLLIGTHRTDESPDLPQRLPGIHSMTLRPLDKTAIARLSESMLGEVGKRLPVVDYLQRQTEGNVFFLIEIVRALAESAGGLRRIGEGVLPEEVLTEGIERIVERRLEHMDAAYHAALEFCATGGRKLDLALLRRVFSDLPLRDFLDQGANAAVFESQGSEWRFAHDKLRETILRRLSAERRRALHRQVGDGLEATYDGAERESLAAQLALHFAQGERPDRATAYSVKAGEQAMRLGLLSTARNHFRDALTALLQLADSPAQRRQRIDLLSSLIYSSQIFDSLALQLERVAEAQSILDSLASDPAPQDALRQVRLDYVNGRAQYYAGQPAQAIRMYQRVLANAQESGDPELTAVPAAVIGMALASQGHINRARPVLLRALGPLRQMGNQFEILRVESYLGMIHGMVGHYRQGVQQLMDCEVRARAIKQPQLIDITQILRAFLLRSAMSFAEVVTTVNGIGAAAARRGEKVYAILAWSLEAWGLAYLGRHDEAIALREKARDIAREMGGKHVVADWFMVSDAETALLRDEPAQAQQIAASVIATSRPANLSQSLGIAERVSAAALHRQGTALDEVETHLRESLAVLNAAELILDSAQTELVWSRILRERADEPAAHVHRERAIAIFQAGDCQAALASI